MSLKLRPVGNRVVIECTEDSNTTPGGVFIPTTARNGEAPSKGRVLAVGPGKTILDGTLIPPSVQQGDEVLFSKRHGIDLDIRGGEYVIIDADDILAIQGAA